MNRSFPCGSESPEHCSPNGGRVHLAARVAASRQSAAAVHQNKRQQRRSAERPLRHGYQRGVALVVTLLMLSIITVVTVAFLALSQRERAAVGQSTMQTVAEMATETARERATAQIMARVLNPGAEMNLFGPDLMVSLAESNALDRLWRDPWVPVYITNRVSPLGEDRTFLDLNRNGIFDPGGFLPWIDANGALLPGPGGGPQVGFFVGDPMWIGVLEDPTRPHAADNRFIARYCFIAVPAGRTLDLNYVHNSVLEPDFGGSSRNYTSVGFFRNQGFGTWEMNFAAFLKDLNTNSWVSYQYAPIPTQRSFGDAFDDARDILSYRATLLGQTNPIAPNPAFAALPFMLPPPATSNNFASDFIDSFGIHLPVPLGRYYAIDQDNPWQAFTNRPWAGAGNRRHFFSVHDYFTLGSGRGALQSFSSRISAASAQKSSYDRYTFYRMLAQVSTDTTSATLNSDRDKINLNYSNATVVNITGTNIAVMHPGAETNFVPWNAREFFLITADRLLTNEFQRFPSNHPAFNPTIGLLNGRSIPVFTNGSANIFSNVPAGPTNLPLYSPSIHRLLQVAANVYQATIRDKAGEIYPFYPTVFQPAFTYNSRGDVFITGYDEVDPAIPAMTSANIVARKWRDLTNGVANSVTNFIPMIFAASKGLPNFNEAAVSTALKVSRRIQFRKNSVADTHPQLTNVMFSIGLSNVIGVEAWNSYSNGLAYPRELKMTFACRSETWLTNNGTLIASSVRSSGSVLSNITAWYGGQFKVPPQVYDIAVSNSVLSPAGALIPLPTRGSVFFEYKPGVSNHLQMTLKNQLMFFLEEPLTGRLIDAVFLGDMNSEVDVSKALDVSGSDSAPYWRPAGEEVQIAHSIDPGSQPPNVWNSFSRTQLAAGEKEMTADELKNFLTTANSSSATLVQAGYTPTERYGQLIKWSVNDPLVHYTMADLVTPSDANQPLQMDLNQKKDYSISLTNNEAEFGPLLGKINVDAYRPWGVGENVTSFKDPGVRNSEDWEFPMQKLPNVGWLGRIHRGTPWQTIYLKSQIASEDDWRDASRGRAWMIETHPTNDWRLVDVFSTAPNDIAARGRLSINQTNLAAWSAVFSGIGVGRLYESNTAIGPIAMPVDEIFQPASADAVAAAAGRPSAMELVVAGINAHRATLSNGMFRTLGEFLSTPVLTDQSPFLQLPYTDQYSVNHLYSPVDSMITDFEMERIPAQILSLVTVGEPRFVIYAWGQALQPAPYGVAYNANKEVVINAAGHPQIEPSSILTSPLGGLFKYCGNYQVTAEVATRTVMRIEADANRLDQSITDPNDPRSFVRPRAVVESFNILPNE